MKVLRISSDVDPETSARIIAEVVKTGVIPDGANAVFEDYETYAARGRVADCDCGLIQYTCVEIRKHKKECCYRLAITTPFAIVCHKHGEEICGECDACNCGGV